MSRGLSYPTTDLKRRVIEYHGGFCLLALASCHGEAQTTDHRANRQAGGSRILNDPVNLIPACHRCNGDKADAHSLTLLDLIERGLYVQAAATHEKTLARVRQTPITDLTGEQFFIWSERDERGRWRFGRTHISDGMQPGRGV